MAARGGLGRAARAARGADGGPDAIAHLVRVVRASGGEARFTLEALLTGLAGDGLRSGTLHDVDAELRRAGLEIDPPLTRARGRDVVRVALPAPLAKAPASPDHHHVGEPAAPRRPRPRVAVLAAALALGAATTAGALLVGGNATDRSATRRAQTTLARAQVALDRGDAALASRLIDDAARSDPQAPGLAPARTRLVALQRQLETRRGAYAAADRALTARRYEAAMRGFQDLAGFADASARATQARDAGRRAALARALRALAGDPSGALVWVARSRRFGDSAQARRVERAAQATLAHIRAERAARAQLSQAQAQLQSQQQNRGQRPKRSGSEPGSGQTGASGAGGSQGSRTGGSGASSRSGAGTWGGATSSGSATGSRYSTGGSRSGAR